MQHISIGRGKTGLLFVALIAMLVTTVVWANPQTAEAAPQQAGNCTYDTGVDAPHLSNWTDASVHGWWLDLGGDCPRTAEVSIMLQAWWCGWGCFWSNVDFDEDEIRSGGGRGKRVNARRACLDFVVAGWRGVADVDLLDRGDPSDTVSAWRNFGCSLG